MPPSFASYDVANGAFMDADDFGDFPVQKPISAQSEYLFDISRCQLGVAMGFATLARLTSLGFHVV